MEARLLLAVGGGGGRRQGGLVQVRAEEAIDWVKRIKEEEY
jgi:hypothetical protein